MTEDAVPGWRRMRFKNNKVWVETDDHGRPLIENQRVRIKYQLDQPHEYRVNPSNLAELGETGSDTGGKKNHRTPARSATRPDSGAKAPINEKPAAKGKPPGKPEAVCDNSEIVVIYTDGASSGNPGPAGIGAVLRYKGGKKEISEYIGHATNNIAELEAVRAALSALKRRDLPVRVYTDSSYVQGLLIYNWKARKNPELVKALRELVNEFCDIRIIKVAGHNGVADNEQADYLATSAITRHKK